MNIVSFLAKTKSSTEWKLITNAISTLVEEPSFEANVEGIQFRGMDPSHVAMIDLNWPNASFEKYECDKEFRLTLRIEELSKLIKRAKQNNSISISAEDDEYMTIKLENGHKREFQIRLIESSHTPQQVPKLALNSKISIDKGVFENTLNDVGVVADHVSIETNKDEIKFVGNGDSGKASIVLSKSDEGVSEIISKEDTKATYSLDYLLNILKAAGTSTETITAEYSNKMPFKLQFRLGEAGGYINFYLAPRIDDK